MPPAPPAASVIVPTYREGPNIQPLVERAFRALREAGIEAELIIVDDDSRDETEAVVRRLQETFPLRLVIRRGERGLSGAVLRGFQEARYDRFVVLDADLQHPPELIPALLGHLDDESCDFVIATRYRDRGSLPRDWPLGRRLASRLATGLARPLAPLSDPMSGFFALRRSTWAHADRLDPVGYKIALELYVKGRCRRPAEVPFQFATRAAGESKFSLRQQWLYAKHLARLYRYRFPWAYWPAILAALAAATILVALAVKE